MAAAETLFDDLPYATRTARLAGTVTLTAEQHEAAKLGRPVEMLVTAVVTTRRFKRKKDSVVETVTLTPITSEVQHVGLEIVEGDEPDDDEAE